MNLVDKIMSESFQRGKPLTEQGESVAYYAFRLGEDGEYICITSVQARTPGEARVAIGSKLFAYGLADDYDDWKAAGFLVRESEA